MASRIVYDGMLLNTSDGRVYRVFEPRWWQLRRWWRWLRAEHKVTITLSEAEGYETVRVVVVEVVRCQG